jgi:hypothetical protein
VPHHQLGHLEALLFGFRALRVDLRFAACLLGRRLECAQAAHFVHDSFGFELALQALERAVDWLSLTDLYFWHFVNSLLSMAGCKYLKNGPRRYGNGLDASIGDFD